MKHIVKILLPGLIVLFSWACNKDYNEEVDVEFYCASKYQFYGNSLIIVDTANNVVSIDANGIQNTTAETLADTILLASKDFTAIEGRDIFYYVKGRASGLVVYPGDSLYHLYSRVWEDYPLSEGETITLDTDSEEGLLQLDDGYSEAGEYKTVFIARNFYDPDSDPKEKIYSIDVKVYAITDVENFYYNVVADTTALKSHFGISDTLDFEAVYDRLF